MTKYLITYADNEGNPVRISMDAITVLRKLGKMPYTTVLEPVSKGIPDIDLNEALGMVSV